MLHESPNKNLNKFYINTSKLDYNNLRYCIIAFCSLITFLCFIIMIYNYFFNFPSDDKRKSKLLITIHLFFVYFILILSTILLQFDNESYLFKLICGIHLSCSISIILLSILILYECYRFVKEKELSILLEHTLRWLSFIVPFLITVIFFGREYFFYKNEICTNSSNKNVNLFIKVNGILLCFVYTLDLIIFIMFISVIKKINEYNRNLCALIFYNLLILGIFSLDLFNAWYFWKKETFYDKQIFILINVSLEILAFFLFVLFFKPGFPKCLCCRCCKSKNESESNSNSENLSSHEINSDL